LLLLHGFELNLNGTIHFLSIISTDYEYESVFISWLVGWFMVFNAIFSNISVLSWRSVLLMEETGLPGENH